MNSIADITPEEKAASLRVQVRTRISAIKNQKANSVVMITNLKAKIASAEVVAAFGVEISDIQAAVAAL